jgi:hypothetical protein
MVLQIRGPLRSLTAVRSLGAPESRPRQRPAPPPPPGRPVAAPWTSKLQRWERWGVRSGGSVSMCEVGQKR